MVIENLSVRQKQIFMFLLNLEDYISAKEISAKFNISVRTIKTDIDAVKEACDHTNGLCKLISKPSKGYRISCQKYSVPEFLELENYYIYSQNRYLEDDIRKAKILLNLTCQKQLTLKTMMSQYYVSRATIYKDLSSIGHYLQNYQISLLYRPYQGISLVGDELALRFALQGCLVKYYSILKDEPALLGFSQFTKANLLQFVNRFAINKISDFELTNLYCHLLVILIRCNISCYLSEDSLKDTSFVSEMDLTNVYSYLYRYKPGYLTIPRTEATFFSLLMKGCNLDLIDENALKITEESLTELSKQVHLDLNQGSRKTELSRYIYSFLIRSHNHFQQNSSLLDEIEQKDLLAFDITYHFAQCLTKRTGYDISCSEIAYMSYFFLNTRDELWKYYEPIKILLVSYRGVSLCHHLLHELQTNFSFYHFEACELYELDDMIQNHDFKIVISDVSVHPSKKIPILLISHFMDSNDFSRIRQYLRQILTSIIDSYIVNRTQLSCSSFHDFFHEIALTPEEEQYLNQRESMYSYASGKSAIVFLYNQYSPTRIYEIPKGIPWNNNLVYYVFVININESNNLLSYNKVIRIFNEHILKKSP